MKNRLALGLAAALALSACGGTNEQNAGVANEAALDNVSDLGTDNLVLTDEGGIDNLGAADNLTAIDPANEAAPANAL